MIRGIAERLQGATTGVIVLAAVADTDPTNAVDVGGHQSAAFLVHIPAGGSQGTFTLTFEESTAIATLQSAIPNKFLDIPKGAQAAFPPGSDPEAANAFAGLTFTDTGTFLIGYTGTKQFLRPVITDTAGSPDFGIFVGVVGDYQRHIGGPA